MKTKLLSRLLLFLIIGLLIAQVLEKRDDVECYVYPHADRYQLVYDQGFVTDQEIRDIVWNALVTEFHGQQWRAALDNVYHAVFMGGSRPDLVLKQLRNPVGEAWWVVTCEGGISWDVRDERERFPVWYSADSRNSKSANDVTIALRRIPQEELQHYRVEATIYVDTLVYRDNGQTEIFERRDVGEISAEDWLAGRIVPEYWSAWHDRWLQHEEKRQAADDKQVD